MSTTSKMEARVDRNQQPQQPKIQIYSTPNDEISGFWREKYERDAKKNSDIFYKRHQDRFFKDRHYLDKEWGHHFSVGCGAGNTVFPLLATCSDIFVHACDFSSHAVDLVKRHRDFTDARVGSMHLFVI